MSNASADIIAIIVLIWLGLTVMMAATLCWLEAPDRRRLFRPGRQRSLAMERENLTQ
jgi:hypothetical protein